MCHMSSYSAGKRKNEEQKNILFGRILQSYIVRFYCEHLLAAASLTIS